MKYRDYIFMTMAAALLLLSACAEEVEVARSGQLPSLYGGKEPYTGTDVTFTVYDSFDPTGTRAAVNGYETTFENGDAIGVYTVTPQGVVRAANVKVTLMAPHGHRLRRLSIRQTSSTTPTIPIRRR